MAKAEKNEKQAKKQKHFWKDFKAELKKVIWPTRSQVVNNTIIVIVIVLIITAIVFVLDLAFEALNTYGIDKLKTMVQNQVVNEVEDNNNQNNASDEEGSESAESNEENNLANNEVANDTANVENVSE